MSSFVPEQALRGSQVAGTWMRRTAPDAWLRGLGLVGLLVLLVIWFTWPLAASPARLIVWHIDPPFSTWRLAWIAHQLFIDPAHLFDANIFHPEPRTLAYSDAVLLEGLLATPFIKAGLPPLLVMNLLVLAGIVTSGLGMYLLTRRLTGSTSAAVLASLIFSFAPYRADHLMHIELQWAVWIPLALWAFHRTLSTGRARDGVMTGVFLLCQLLSCIYYALFLSVTLAIVGGASLLVWRSRLTPRVLGGLIAGLLLVAVVAVPYGRPYRDNVHTLGTRAMTEIGRYSATPTSYLSVTPEHAMYGSWSGGWSESEKRLFPGFVAIVLVVLAFVPPICSTRWIYLAVLAFAVEASFGLNGWLYPVLRAWLTPFQGLRVPGRFGILVLLGVGVLAAYGAARVLRVTPAAWRRPLAILLGGVMMLEYQMAPAYMEALPTEPPSVYRWLAREPKPTVTIEFPLPDPFALPAQEPFYMYFSTMHWQPLLNGYSGHYPPSYFTLLDEMKEFPSDRAMDWLRARSVTAIIVHERFFEKPDAYREMVGALDKRADVRLMGTWKDHRGEARGYRLSGAQARR